MLKILMHSSFFHSGMSRHSTAYVKRYWSPLPGCMAASACTSGCDCGLGTRVLYRFSLASPYYFRCWRCSASREAGREISDLMARQPDWFDRTLLAANVPRGHQRELLAAVQNWTLQGYVATLALVLLARAIRSAIERRSRIRLTYPGGIEVAVPRGLTVLEASRFAGIPHTIRLWWRGRCSTCRVRVVRGADSLPPAKPAEVRVLQRVGAPPNVRLACQLRPTADLSITPLVPASGQAWHGFMQPSYLAGEERNIVVLFADLRSFTGMAELQIAV